MKENGFRKVFIMWKVRRGCWGLPFQITPELCELFVHFDLFAGDPLNVL